ncbi:glycoside hydrolase superfamily, partial [Syncephalastrum racemosum]
KRAAADDWKSRSIYQIVTDRFARSDGSTSGCGDLSNYCGGDYKGIQNQLDYIAGMGFDAIWISPIPENTDGGYHGYWAKNFEALNTNFGSADDLKALVTAAHGKGMYVMLDVVANHAGPTSGGDYSGFTFDSASNYHAQCDIDYENQTSIEQCWVADNLPDINTEDDTIVSKLHSIVSDWVTTYDFDGIRIDTVKHIRKDFWSGYEEAAGVFATGEVFDGDAAYVGPYQDQLSSLINYPLYYAIRDVFTAGSGFSRISDMLSSINSNFKDPSVLTTFVDNQDNARFLSVKSDTSLYKNALAFTILTEGIPVVYYGTEQGFKGGNDPNNREVLWTSNYDTSSDLYKFIKIVNDQVRQKSNKTVKLNVDVGTNTYAFTHGKNLIVVNNYGSGSTASVTVKVGDSIADGTKLVDAVSNITATVSGGSITFSLNNGLPALF